MSTLKVHWQIPSDMANAGSPFCGSLAKSPSMSTDRNAVDCGNCLRVMNAYKCHHCNNTVNITDQPAHNDAHVAELLAPGPAGFIQALGSVLPSTTAKMELDENGRIIGDDSPFTVLESIDLTKPVSNDTGYMSFLADTYLAPCQPIGCDNGYHLPGCQFASADGGLSCDGCDKVRSVRSDDGRTVLCRDCRRMYRKAVRKPHAPRAAMHGKPRKPKTGTRRAMRDCMSARKHRANPGNKHHKIRVAVGA